MFFDYLYKITFAGKKKLFRNNLIEENDPASFIDFSFFVLKMRDSM